MKRRVAAFAWLGALLLAGCGSMSYFPPQNLGEVKKGAGDLRQAKVLVSLSAQMQLDRTARTRGASDAGSAPKAQGGDYYEHFLGLLSNRLAQEGARPTTELRDVNDLAAPKLAELIEKERPDYVLRMSQQSMGTINAQPASLVWLVQLAHIRPGAADVVFEHQYSVSSIFCLGSKLREFAEPTAMQCLQKQADHIVDRLVANNFFNGAPTPAQRQGDVGGAWSEPPARRVIGSEEMGSSLCARQAPGIQCK